MVQLRLAGTGLTFHADNRAIEFFPKSLGAYPANRFPGGADYVSSNNWYIDCNGTTFKVHRPDGVVYHLNVQEYYKTHYLKLGSGGHVLAKNSATKKTVYVSKIVDPHNNTLTFTTMSTKQASGLAKRLLKNCLLLFSPVMAEKSPSIVEPLQINH